MSTISDGSTDLLRRAVMPAIVAAPPCLRRRSWTAQPTPGATDPGVQDSRTRFFITEVRSLRRKDGRSWVEAEGGVSASR